MAAGSSRHDPRPRDQRGTTAIDVAMVAAIVASALVVVIMLLGGTVPDLVQAAVDLFA